MNKMVNNDLAKLLVYYYYCMCLIIIYFLINHFLEMLTCHRVCQLLSNLTGFALILIV